MEETFHKFHKIQCIKEMIDFTSVYYKYATAKQEINQFTF